MLRVESLLKQAENPQGFFFSPKKTKSCFVIFENVRKASFPLKENHGSLLLKVRVYGIRSICINFTL